ncbi:MAG: hypothetical protein R3257_06130, partial [bacterium]|nr:hypothetical protein [bacterium]
MSSSLHLDPVSPSQGLGPMPLQSQAYENRQSPGTVFQDLVREWNAFLRGEIKLKEVRKRMEEIFHRHGVGISGKEVQEFTETLAEATLAWHRARNAARVAEDMPPVIYSHYTPGPSGLNPGDPRTYAMAPNPGWKTMVTGAAILATAPGWVPIAGELSQILISACLTNPVRYNNWGYQIAQGLIKGTTGQKT